MSENGSLSGLVDEVREPREPSDLEWMSMVGAMVAGLAHEVRNPLFAISSTLDAFESRFGDRKDQAQYLYVLRTQLARLNGLMQQLLDYGKPGQLSVASERIDGLIEEAVASRAALAEHCGVILRARLAAGLPALVLDRQRVLQALENLIDNALHHSPRGGTVEVVVREETAGERRSGARLVMEVRDQGPGFESADLPRVFEPFFTRRPEGTGMGLSIVQRIVEQHGGSVVAANRAEGGAVVTLRLPLYGPGATEAQR